MKGKDQITKLLFGVDVSEIEEYLNNNPEIRQRFAAWTSKKNEFSSLGDALFCKIMADLVGEDMSGRLQCYLDSCKLSDNKYTPIPADDSRWGSVEKEIDVYSVAQGGILDWLLNDSEDSIKGAYSVIDEITSDMPFNNANSDTEVNYRKLSEVMMQAHYCAIISSITESSDNNNLESLCINTIKFWCESEYKIDYMSSIYHGFILSHEHIYEKKYDRCFEYEDIYAAVKRLETENGYLEYKITDKVDENARSRSRSSRDQEHEWTYSTAYGLIMLRLLGKGNDISDQIYASLRLRLLEWPDHEEVVKIKEYENIFCDTVFSYSAVSALCAMAISNSE